MVIFNGNVNESALVPCTQEEADTRIFLHILNPSVSGSTRALVGTVDTDVAVIAVALFTRLSLKELWLWFGTGNNQQYIPIHTTAVNLGSVKSSSLSLFHALTGCDQVYFFCWTRKEKNMEYMEAVCRINRCARLHLYLLSARKYKYSFALEGFVVFFYDPKRTCASLNECKKDLFSRKVNYHKNSIQL